MIKGAKYADRDIYSQENNPIEAYNKKAHNKTGWLESCGPSSFLTCCAAILPKEPKCILKGPYGEIEIQPEQAVFDIMNSPENYKYMLPLRDNLGLNDLQTKMIPSRVPQYFSWPAKLLFNIDCEFKWNYVKTPFEDVKNYIIDGNPIQLCLIAPAHYIAAVKFDMITNEIIYHDSYPSRWPDKSGKNRRMGKVEFLKNTQRFYNIFHKELLK